MSKLPALSGEKCIKALVVPLHKELDRGTLRAIIRQAGLSVAEFSGFL
jgi:predicted RNA binding protein YcfA (HicA-like mRNA interferase family)